MAYTIKQIDNEPIFIITYQDHFIWTAEPAEISHTLGERVRAIDGEQYVAIHDMRALSVSFTKILEALASSRHLWNEARLSGWRALVVSPDRQVKLMTEAARHNRFFPVPVEVLPTLEQALTRAQEIIANQGEE